MIRLRGFAKEKQRRHEDDSVDPRRKYLLVKKKWLQKETPLHVET